MLCGMEGEVKGQAQRPGDRWGVGLQTQTKEAGAGRLLSTGWGSQRSVSPGEPAPPPPPGPALVTMPFSMSHFQAMVTGCGSSVQPKRHNRGESQASRLTFWVGRFPPFLSLVIAVCVILLPSRCPPTREDNLRERR